MIQQMIYRRSEQGYRTVAASEMLVGKSLCRHIESLSTLAPSSGQKRLGVDPVYSRCAVEKGLAVLMTAVDPGGIRGSHITHAWYVPEQDTDDFAHGNAIPADKFIREYRETSRMDVLPCAMPKELCREDTLSLGCSAAKALFGKDTELLAQFLTCVIGCGQPVADRGFLGVCALTDAEDASLNAYRLMETVLRAYAQQQVDTVGYRSMWNRAEDNVRYPVFFTTPDLIGSEASVPMNYVLFDLRTGAVRLPRGMKLTCDAHSQSLAQALLSGNATDIRTLQQKAEEEFARVEQQKAEKRTRIERERREAEKRTRIERERREAEERARIERERHEAEEQARVERLRREAEERARAEEERIQQEQLRRTMSAPKPVPPKPAQTYSALDELLWNLDPSESIPRATVDRYLTDMARGDRGETYLRCAEQLLKKCVSVLENGSSRQYNLVARCAYKIAECALAPMAIHPEHLATGGCKWAIDQVNRRMNAQQAQTGSAPVRRSCRNEWFIYLSVLDGVDDSVIMTRCASVLYSFIRNDETKTLKRTQNRLNEIACLMLKKYPYCPPESGECSALMDSAVLAALYARMQFDHRGRLGRKLVQMDNELKEVLREIRITNWFEKELMYLIDELSYRPHP